MNKNETGQEFDFVMVDSTGAEITTGTTTLFFRGDAGSWITSPQTPTYVTNAWKWSPNQAETNYTRISLKPTSSIGALPQVIDVYPRALVAIAADVWSYGTRTITASDGTEQTALRPTAAEIRTALASLFQAMAYTTAASPDEFGVNFDPATNSLRALSDRIPAALSVNGYMESYIEQMATSSLGSAAIATGAITSAKFAAGAITADSIANNALTSGKAHTSLLGVISQNAWSYGTRTITDFSGFAPADMWNYNFGTQTAQAAMEAVPTVAAIWDHNTGTATAEARLESIPTAVENRQELDSNGSNWVAFYDRLTTIDSAIALLPGQCAVDVWGATERTLTTFGDELIASITTSVWGAAERALTDKAGFAPSAIAIVTEMDANSVMLATIDMKADSAQVHLDALDERIPATLVNGRINANIGAITNGAITAASITAGAFTSTKFDTGSITADALATDAKNALATSLLTLASGIETGVTVQAALRRIGAVVAGKASGAGYGQEVFVGLDGATTRVTVTVDSSGNRTGVAYS